MSQTDQNRKDKDQQPATPPVMRLAAAEVDVAAAKDRLNDTVAKLQSKLDPKLIAKEATDEAKRVGDKGLTFARDNQSVLAGLAGGMLLYMIRKPIFRLFKRRKGPKPQRAAKPMTATAPNQRLARSPHPTAAPVKPKPPLSPAHPTQAAPVTTSTAPASPVTTSNEGALFQGSIA
jgi:hypothetical protein